MRFPELFRYYAKNNVNICFLPVQWPAKRISHFKKLLFARAIENQMYMVSSNIVGNVKNTLFGGNSMIVDFMGKPLRNLGKKINAIETVTVNTDKLFEWRTKFPVLNEIDFTENKKIDYFEF